MGIGAAIASAVIAAAGTAASVQQQRKAQAAAAEQQKKAEKAANAQATLESQGKQTNQVDAGSAAQASADTVTASQKARRASSVSTSLGL